MVNQLDLFLAAKDSGITWTTNHNKSVVRGLVSQPNMAYVGQIIWRLSMAEFQWIVLT